MTRPRHFAQPLLRTLSRASLGLLLSALFVGGLSGCHRKTLRPMLPIGSLAPVELEAALDSDTLPEVETVPLPELPTLPPPPPAPPTPKKKPAAREEADSPLPNAAAAEQAALAIGVLSIGGDAAPQSQQTARDLIAAITKRIAALPTQTADARKNQVRQVKHFLDQAQQALNSGDADGAMNLATKAKLLMDDLEKK